MPTYDGLEALAARVRFDLESAGFTPLSREQEDSPEGGLMVVTMEGQVRVAWQTHDRLGEASLDMTDAGRSDEDVVHRDQTVRAAMHLTIGSILHAFGYRTVPGPLGFGHAVIPEPH